MPTPVVLLPLAPVLLAIVPPLPALPVPVTVKPPVPVLSRIIPVAEPPLDVMLWNVSPLAPIVVLTTFKAVAPEVLLMVLPVPCTVTAVAPPVALKPVPLEVLMTNPPPVKLIVPPALLLRLTAVLAPVFRFLVLPLKAIVPPVLLATLMPVPVSLMFPDNVTVPPVRPVTSTERLEEFVIEPA